MNKNTIAESVIASIIFAALWATATLLLHDFGLNSPVYPVVVLVILLAIIFIYLIVRKAKRKFTRWLTWHLLTNALSPKHNVNTTDKAFKKKIVDKIFRTTPSDELLLEYNDLYGSNTQTPLIEFDNQIACEQEIQKACEKAKKVKILTIRGEKYFLGYKNLLREICLGKQGKEYSIEVLVLSPDSDHITENLSASLGKNPQQIRTKMRIALDNLKHIMELNRNIRVKCYKESPNFKILIFDDEMFVSSFAQGRQKNDHNAKMFQITRDNNPLFAGLERFFDDLSSRAEPLQ
jgi:hypothetical protein